MYITTMQKLINQLDAEIRRNTLGGIQYYGLLRAKQMAMEMQQEVRSEIETAYNDAKNYPDPNCDGGKYYFMNYISND
jgi:hypothetical protein